MRGRSGTQAGDDVVDSISRHIAARDMYAAENGGVAGEEVHEIDWRSGEQRLAIDNSHVRLAVKSRTPEPQPDAGRSNDQDSTTIRYRQNENSSASLRSRALFS